MPLKEPKPRLQEQEQSMPVVSFALPKKTDEPRLESVIVRMLPADKATLRRLAEEAGMSLSAYCRVVLLKVIRQATDAEKT